jgi:predicted nuclease of restriction endonuclease-like (RecB) superfamily
MPAKKKSGNKRTPKKGSVVDPTAGQEALFDRVATILEQARANVVRAVNSNMVLAYWLIGREIVQEIQGGGKRAAYGKQVLAELSRRLTENYGQGFSVTNLQNFRKFHEAYARRLPQIQHPMGIKSWVMDGPLPIQHPMGAELARAERSSSKSRHAGAESEALSIRHPAGDELVTGFSPLLSWSHYRALMRVENAEARDFYEREAIAGGWDKRTLERQIHSFYYERLLKSQDPKKMLAGGRELQVRSEPAAETLRNPYVLEFLGLPEVAKLHESDLEAAILTYLQAFLLELGKGFAFVARQKRLRFGDDDRYVDLVFYHCHLKFYLLIDLKLGELTHGDVGQMDGYVRMFDDLVAIEGDNPTIGLILCTEKNETVAKYSVLKDRKQIFASKYMLYLPTEEELRLEIERERRLIEGTRKEFESP